MKKLLILLFSILISFNSFAGSIDGKGLKCVHEFSFETPPTLYVWFENNNYIIPYLEGYSIVWTQPSKYREDPNYITFNDENWNGDLYLFNWLSKRVYRSTLKMGNHYDDPKYHCTVLYSKQQILDDIIIKIDAAKSTNKI